MERGLEVEDDLFYADLTKRISLLIMDDDDDLKLRYPPPLSLEGHHRVVGQPLAASHPLLLHRRDIAAPAYMRETKGTGVFIPRSSQPRRKNRSGRSRQQQGRAAKQEEEQQQARSSSPCPGPQFY